MTVLDFKGCEGLDGTVKSVVGNRGNLIDERGKTGDGEHPEQYEEEKRIKNN